MRNEAEEKIKKLEEAVVHLRIESVTPSPGLKPGWVDIEAEIIELKQKILFTIDA